MSSDQYSRLKGTHAPFSPSTPYWLRYDEEKLIETYRALKAKELGTRIHALAAEHIELGIRMPGTKKTLDKYINDAIGLRMTPEQLLYYSDHFYGTADAIKLDPRKGQLIVHDLKTGVKVKPKIEQLWVYAALYCLEHNIRPGDIEPITRLYFQDEIIEENPSTEDIIEICDKIKSFDKLLDKEDSSY